MAVVITNILSNYAEQTSVTLIEQNAVSSQPRGMGNWEYMVMMKGKIRN
jgi:hypothetical protein